MNGNILIWFKFQALHRMVALLSHLDGWSVWISRPRYNWKSCANLHQRIWNHTEILSQSHQSWYARQSSAKISSNSKYEFSKLFNLIYDGWLQGQTEDPDPEKHPVPLKLCSKMIEWINEFQIGVSIVKIMCNPALRDRHWLQMSEIAGQVSFHFNEHFSFSWQ